MARAADEAPLFEIPLALAAVADALVGLVGGNRTAAVATRLVAAALLGGVTGDKVAGFIRYFTGLAEDQLRRDSLGRGPVDYYLDPDEPPGRWWGNGRASVGLDGGVPRAARPDA